MFQPRVEIVDSTKSTNTVTIKTEIANRIASGTPLGCQYGETTDKYTISYHTPFQIFPSSTIIELLGFNLPITETVAFSNSNTQYFPVVDSANNLGTLSFSNPQDISGLLSRITRGSILKFKSTESEIDNVLNGVWCIITNLTNTSISFSATTPLQPFFQNSGTLEAIFYHLPAKKDYHGIII